ncbi:MAG: response regulator transcription factor [Aureliella sp.]
MMHRLLIADDHPVAQQGVAQFCSAPDLKIVALVCDGKSTLAACEKLAPDLVLLDVRLGSDDGLAVLQTLAELPAMPRVVMMSGHENPTYIARAAAFGAYDFVLKDSSRTAFLAAIRNCLNGTAPPASSSLLAMKAVLARRTESNTWAPLTRRETQVLVHLSLGLKNKEISASLGVACDTVKEHVQSILRKLNVNDRTAAALRAARGGLLDDL